MNSKQLQLFKGTVSEKNWDFTEADTQNHSHGLHPYPARMIPQIAERLIDDYVKSHGPGVIADVFCGSGTVIVEASIKGLPSVGIDINPFAVFLSKAKVTVVNNDEKLRSLKHSCEQKIKDFNANIEPKYIPSFFNLRHWFKEQVITKLGYLRQFIDSIDDPDIRRIFLSAFSRTVMNSSNVNWRSSRYIRVFPEENLRYHNPDVFQIFIRSLMEVESRIKAYMKKRKNTALVIRGDALNTSLADRSINLIITSPPYGEERNTIPYMRWSKLFLFWLGMEANQVNKIERESLGGRPKNNMSYSNIPSETFLRSVEKVEKKRIEQALPFMAEYFIWFKEMNRILAPNGVSCIVIGHRSIQRNMIDMGEVTKEFGTKVGFRCEAIHKRRIPKKLIPWIGPTGATIANESIVILRKE